MKQLFFFFLGTILFTNPIYSSDISIITTTGSWRIFAGYISNLEIEVTPDNHYARVELTFEINVDSLNSHNWGYGTLPTYNNQLLEGQLNFRLPENAYFYDSYLWLNPSVIIRAAIVSKRQGNRVYDSIVNRKTDPSILQKTYDGYSLKVFPISTTFKRKVKIAYSIPFSSFQTTKEYLELPTDFIQLISPNSSFRIRVNKSNSFNFISTLFPLKSTKILENNDYSLIEIQANNLIKNVKSYLEFENNRPQLISFFYQYISPNEGYYDIRIRTNLIPNLPKSTTAFNLSIPFNSNGFIYNRYNLTQNKLLNTTQYNESGKYYGQINMNDSIILDYKLNNQVYTIKQKIQIEDSGKFLFQNWTNLYCLENSDEDALKESIQNRVLTAQSAFLALENGDTVTQAKSDNMGGGIYDNTSSIKSPISKATNINVYPNPIVDLFTIDCDVDIQSIIIMDYTGKKIYELQVDRFKKEIQLNSNDLGLKKGIYLLVVETKNYTHSIKIIKE